MGCRGPRERSPELAPHLSLGPRPSTRFQSRRQGPWETRACRVGIRREPGLRVLVCDASCEPEQNPPWLPWLDHCRPGHESCLEATGQEQPAPHPPLCPQAPAARQPDGCVAAGGRLSPDPPGTCGLLTQPPPGLGLWALGASAGSAGQVSMTPGEPGGGGGLARRPCAVKPRTPPRVGLSRGPRLLGPCPPAAPGPGHPAPQPGSVQVKGGPQEDRHSCPAAAGPSHCSGSPFHRLPVPVGPAGSTGRGTSPRAQAAAPVLSPRVPRNRRASSQRPGAGWSRQCLGGLCAAPPSRPPPPHPQSAALCLTCGLTLPGPRPDQRQSRR